MFKARTLRLPALLLAFTAFTTVTALTAYAGHHESHHDGKADSARAEKRIERFVGEMEKELKLSKDQSERIRAILRRDPVAPPHAEMGDMQGAHEQVLAQLRSGTVDTAALNRSFEERVNAMRARHASMTAKFAEIHAVLTPEQRKKAAEILEKRAARMEKRHKRARKAHQP